MISFTAKERSLLADTDFFETKAVITQKVRQFHEALHPALKEELQGVTLLAPEGTDIEKGQFVKGEHLHDFPYLYLDFPKFFSHTDKFTFRSLFWWGHHFVFAWILEGEYLESYKENLLNAYAQLADQGLYLLLSQNPWEWRKEDKMLLEIKKENPKVVREVLASRTFLKIQRFISFDHSAVQNGRLIDVAIETFRLMKPIVMTRE